MGINLSKGGRVNLSKEAPALNHMVVGLGWDANESDTGEGFDLDASVFLVGSNGKTTTEKDFVYYNNLTSTDGSVQHTGDNTTGEGDGDDEQVKLDLSKVGSDIQEVIFVVTIHEAQARNQNFGQVSNSFIRIVDESNGSEILKYELDEDYSIETAIEFGKLYRKDGSWRFQAVGTGFSAGLQGFVDKYMG
ncbi:MAG: TerD family protein [Campylobacterota bacterium]|nr:TerD family protein [Campylobacterota bacterium]